MTAARFAALSAAVSYPVYIWHQAIIWVFWNSRANRLARRRLRVVGLTEVGMRKGDDQ